MSSSRIEIQDYQDAWVREFRDLGHALRQALGDTAVRIDHVGSTAVPGLAGKPIIDVQVSVAVLDPMDRYRSRIESLGFVWRQNDPEKTKRYFRERPGSRRTHVHVRRAGSWHEQYALLFRDYLRKHSGARNRYEQVKRELAAQFPEDRPRYTDAKGPMIWQIMQEADRWAAAVGWEPGGSDA